MLAATARVNLLLYPSDSVTYVHIVDVFRFGFYIALAAGAAASIRNHWASETTTAELRAARSNWLGSSTTVSPRNWASSLRTPPALRQDMAIRR